MNQKINLISDQCYFGLNTVAEINNQFHYMGSEPANIATAVFAWQEIHGRELTTEELHQIMIDNRIIGEKNDC